MICQHSHVSKTIHKKHNLQQVWLKYFTPAVLNCSIRGKQEKIQVHTPELEPCCHLVYSCWTNSNIPQFQHGSLSLPFLLNFSTSTGLYVLQGFCYTLCCKMVKMKTSRTWLSNGSSLWFPLYYLWSLRHGFLNCKINVRIPWI